MSVRDAVKSLVPQSVRTRIRAVRDGRSLDRLTAEWTAALLRVRPRVVRRPIEKLLILPSDPATLVGALGDDAMMQACAGVARQANPAVAIHVLTAGPQARQQAQVRGWVAEDIWNRPDFLSAYADLLNAQGFDSVAALGADMMDGYYGLLHTAKTVAACDIAVRSGVPATILGFSFNSHPAPALKGVFARAQEQVRFNVRDAVSFERFRAFSPATPARLVADSAFFMKPIAPDAASLEWIAARRAEGLRVVGINLHPMLVKNATEEQVQELIARGAQALRAAAVERRVAFFLLPHDYRGAVGDARCLRPIYEQIRGELAERVRFLEGEHPAAFLKGIAGALDGVTTGRMHLAIGTLGAGVPVSCLTYQDKFEGLMGHFGLPGWLLMSPDAYLAPERFEVMLTRFIDELDALRAQVGARLPQVMAASRVNFDAFAAD